MLRKNHVPLLGLLVLAVISFLVLQPFFIAIILGSITAYVMFPIYRWLRKYIKNKTASSLIICAILVLLVVGPGIFLVKSLVFESQLVQGLAKLRLAGGVLDGCTNNLCLTIQGYADDPNIGYRIQEGIKAATGWIVQKGSNFLWDIPQLLLSGLVVLFTCFYLLKDGKDLLRRVPGHVGLKKTQARRIYYRLREITHGVVYGYILVGVIQGAAGAIGFLLFGISSPLFWGVIMMVFALIPFLGTGIVWGPAALILIFDGVTTDSSTFLWKGVGLLVYGFFIVGGLDNLLRPKLMGEKAKIHPLIIILGIFGGIIFFGPMGVVVGPLVLSLTWVLFKELMLTKNKEEVIDKKPNSE